MGILVVGKAKDGGGSMIIREPCAQLTDRDVIPFVKELLDFRGATVSMTTCADQVVKTMESSIKEIIDSPDWLRPANHLDIIEALVQIRRVAFEYLHEVHDHEVHGVGYSYEFAVNEEF